MRLSHLPGETRRRVDARFFRHFFRGEKRGWRETRTANKRLHSSVEPFVFLAGVLLCSRMPMRNTFFTLVLLGASLFGLSLSLHAEDLPETPYDESQQSACEHRPLSSIQVVRDSIPTTQPTQESATPSTLVSLTNHHELLVGMPEWPVLYYFAAPAIISPPIRR